MFGSCLSNSCEVGQCPNAVAVCDDHSLGQETGGGVRAQVCFAIH